VIDDEDIFPTIPFQDAGYNIDKWDKVKDYNKLENRYYDIIILDIFDVAQHLSDEDGLGVLESLKGNNSSQIIIAYSGHSFDLSKQKFWDLADEKIAKPSGFLKIKQIIDVVIAEKFTIQRYWRVIESILASSNYSQRIIDKIEEIFVNALNSGKELDWNAIRLILDNNSVVLKTTPVANTITKNFSKK